ncbi:vacuolar protein 14 C-terminal Fig4p binding-domain-containing protein [Phascolomyces articulosus]|uniref:Vacuolar protein 14 C-terminal Fig4p binding-domain-containing protein n=1 Tax=Phascolomyces articulosus TaxID=60185 RepID=A0AAD5JSH6_9FUNG|nr:vacuolar protein 14 C-terminal Fig4p binding-domain-containing protein [Phascolomyces articulosus]
MKSSVFSPTVIRELTDKTYDRRKVAALEVESLVKQNKESHEQVIGIIQELVNDFVYSDSSNAQCGGLISLAATAIALGPRVAEYLDIVVPPILACFNSKESRVRYYACECMYNVAKVSKGELLRFFNGLFEGQCMLSNDKEPSVRNGREILDRLIKEIVCELAVTYVSPYSGNTNGHGSDQEQHQLQQEGTGEKAFSLSKFIPVLRRHVYTSNPYERMYVMSWIGILDAVPGLDLVWYLPDVLDGIIRYLTDSHHQIRANARLLLAQFFQEIQFISRQNEDEGTAMSQKRPNHHQTQDGHQQQVEEEKETRSTSSGEEEQQQQQHETISMMTKSTAIAPSTPPPSPTTPIKQIQYDRILDILIQHVSSTKEEIQRTALQWMIEFIAAAKPVVIQFTPRIIHAVLPLLAHPIPTISSFAMETNRNLQKLVLEYSLMYHNGRAGGNVDLVPSHSDPPSTTTMKTKTILVPPTTTTFTTKTVTATTTGGPIMLRRTYRSDIGLSTFTRPKNGELFDYSMTVANLKLQFLSEHEQTRLASLEWLLLLHKKAPNKVIASVDSILPELFKTLSDPSEEVVYRDLELLAQIAYHSDDDTFHIFVKKLLLLFERDRRLLESRGSMIIRQLCIHLDVEKMYCTMATILQNDQDMEFACMMVQNLNIIMITSSEMNCLRKQLRSLDTKHGQQLFLTLFRSWSHNAVAAFSLALIAQAYELASNMLQIFAELDITVNMLIQLDQMVQLLESPAFTYLRLQLLEPDKYPYLFKCLYGIFMLLPQSSAFSTLRSRLNSASSLGFLHVMPKR